MLPPFPGLRRGAGPSPCTRRSGSLRRAPLLIAALLVAAAILAGCTLPAEDDPLAATLVPYADRVPGLSPDRARSHPVAVHVVDNQTIAVALAGTIARPDHRVQLLDLQSGAIKATFETGLRPLALIPDPLDANRLLVTHPYTAAISVLDLDLGIIVDAVRVPYYIEQGAFSPDGKTFVATDRDQDRLLVFQVDRSNRHLQFTARDPVATGPNPEHVVFVHAGLVAVSNRHGASITLVALDTLSARTVEIGGPPLALTSRAGLLFVAGYAAGRGAPEQVDGTPETGTADLENSLLVMDLRAGAALASSNESVPRLRYVSDTARPDNAHPDLRILAGASPWHLAWDPTDARLLWVTYQGTDQVQKLVFTPPAADSDPGTLVLSPPSGATGTRLSHLPANTPLTPGQLTDTTHGIYETGPGPRASARLGGYLLSLSELSETVRITNLNDCPGPSAPTAPCTHRTIPVVADATPYPNGLFEEGERLFISALPSADQDRSCAGCHIDGLADGKRWNLPHRAGAALLTPRLDDLVHASPWLVDGSVDRPSLYLTAAGGDLLASDPADPWNLGNADEKSNTSAGASASAGTAASARLSGLVATITTPAAWMNATFAFALGEPRMLPTPPRLADDVGAASLKTGGMQFRKTSDCMSCHLDTGPTFVPSRTIDPTWGPPAPERLKARPLVGLWDRDGTPWMYDGRALELSHTLLPANSECLPPGSGEPTAWHAPLSAYTCSVTDDVARFTLLQNRES